jgi:hypothetical protein
MEGFTRWLGMCTNTVYLVVQARADYILEADGNVRVQLVRGNAPGFQLGRT